MDERKRPRMEISTNGNLNRGCCQQNIYVNTSITDNVMEMMGSESLTTTKTNTVASAGATLPKNLFLTICEDNSSESQEEFVTIDNRCMKQDTQYTTTGTTVEGGPITATRKYGLNVGLSAINAQTAAALLPATVQLPSGCEIYLVKEYVEPPPLTPTNAPRTVISSATSSSSSFSSTITKTNAIAKYKSGIITTTSTPAAAAGLTTTTTANINYESLGTSNITAGAKSGLQIVRKPMPMITQTQNINQQTQMANNNHNNINNNSNQNNNNNNHSNCINKNNDIDEQRSEFDKQSELLEAYKKRDDKRRATHNEVERRRRDKINSWIFKLKEMLPSEIPNYTIPIDSESCMNNNSNSNSSTSDQQQSTMQQGQQRNNNHNNNSNCRNLPCDSKSQILIKACEYIKSMQQEMKSLRECLAENENLRLYNERLQNELSQFKNEQQQQQEQEQQQQLTTTVLDEEENIVDEDDVVMVHCNGHLTVNDSDDAVDGHTDDDDLTHNLNSNPNSNFNVTLNSLNNLGGNGDSIFMTSTNNMVTVIDGKRDLLMQNYVD